MINELNDEYGLSQVFICFDTRKADKLHMNSQITDHILDFIHSAAPSGEGKNVYYSGEKALLTREENKRMEYQLMNL